MRTKLIIIDGHSSVGKSSVSKSVYQQIAREHDAYWLHEECEDHPIRKDEFSYGPLNTFAGMELNRKQMLKKWGDFRDMIKASGKVCITEGCLLHAYDRYFIHSIWNYEEIVAYYSQVIDVINELNPIIIMLYRPDLRKSLEKAFIARGEWWKDLILKRDDLHVYFKDHVYINDESMFDAIQFEQQKMMDIFDQLHCSRAKIDTSAENWDQYIQEIISLFPIQYRRLIPHQCNMEEYQGTYRWQNGSKEDTWVIKYDPAGKCLYTSLFWPYMPMRCKAEDVFELISFPVELHFEKDGQNIQFSVHGNYEWEYNDQVFIRI